MFKATHVERTDGNVVRVERRIPAPHPSTIDPDGTALLVEYLTEAQWATLIKADGTDVDQP